MEDQITIAIVDDNSIYRKLLTKIAELAKISVAFQAEDGMDCLLKMAESTVLPHLLLLDIEMPIMDGFETARLLKARWPQLKIIAHSSIADPASIRRVMDCGADTFLPKHCTPGELITAIKQFQYP